MKIKLLSITLVLAFAFSSCATLFRPSTTIDSGTESGVAELIIGNNKPSYDIGFPYRIKDKLGYSSTPVYAKTQDGATARLEIKKKFNGVFIVDLLFFWPGAIIDLLTGGVTKPESKHYNLHFKYNDNNNNYQQQNYQQPVQQSVAAATNQQQKSTIYIYSGTLLKGRGYLIALDGEYLTDMGGNSYVKIVTTSDRVNIKDYYVSEGSTFESVKDKKCPQHELILDNDEYYLYLNNSVNIQPKTRVDFNNKVNKLNYKGEFKWNYEEPMIASINAIQQQTQPTATPSTATAATLPHVITSDVDVNIPKTDRKASDTFVLIIANEHYTFVDNVDYAIHDGEVFKEYCIKTLGVPERQVWLYQDATGGIIAGGVDKMVQAMSLFEDSKAIVYYCGHGIPDEHTGDAYIVPTDGKGTNTATCYSLNKMYTTLAKSNAKSVTYFMDACFSGANKEGSMLVAARGVAREAKKETLTGNTVVFSAASGDETAMTFKEKGHGLFTYFLLKKLQETNGDVSYGDLDKYIKDNVKRESFLTNEKVQHPATNVSENTANIWKQMKLK